MSDRVDLLTKELDNLHRGRGLYAPGIVARLGPILSALIFGDNEPDEVIGRGLISAHLFAAAEALPPDLAMVFKAGLGVSDDSPYLTTRLENVGTALNRGPRTISRRLHEANRAVAQALERRTGGWVLRSITQLAAANPHATQHRRGHSPFSFR